MIPDGTAEEARLAIDAAERAQPGWEALPAIERAGWLRKIAAGIRQRADEIAGLIVAEGGKIQQLAAVEVAFTADYLDYMAEWARRYEGEIVQSDRPGENILVFKRALGVTTDPAVELPVLSYRPQAGAGPDHWKYHRH